MSVKYLFKIAFFDNGYPRWENIDKFLLENTSPPPSCLGT